jgi:hypothetical protein
MQALILTSCTNRKRVPPDAGLRGAHLDRGELATVAEAWVQRLRSAGPRTKADVLYCGRTFRDAKVAADRAQGVLYIVSAGLGLVPAHANVPSYSLTVSPNSSESVLTRIAGNCTAPRWWDALVSRSPFSDQLATVVQQHPGPIHVALPATYISMVSAQIDELPSAARARLRIFTGMPSPSIPLTLKPYKMPYDARFDGAGTLYPGTQGDFAQRALLHFVERILPQEPTGDAEAHTKAVNASLANLRAPVIPHRQRLSDRALIDLIHKHWDAARGQSGRMLRVLRDDLEVACEQSRFRSLFDAAKEQRATIR